MLIRREAATARSAAKKNDPRAERAEKFLGYMVLPPCSGARAKRGKDENRARSARKIFFGHLSLPPRSGGQMKKMPRAKRAKKNFWTSKFAAAKRRPDGKDSAREARRKKFWTCQTCQDRSGPVRPAGPCRAEPDISDFFRPNLELHGSG